MTTTTAPAPRTVEAFIASLFTDRDTYPAPCGADIDFTTDEQGDEDWREHLRTCTSCGRED